MRENSDVRDNDGSGFRAALARTAVMALALLAAPLVHSTAARADTVPSAARPNIKATDAAVLGNAQGGTARARAARSGVSVTRDQLTITPYYCDPAKPTQTYTVPEGVHSLYLEAVGGEGQTPDPNKTGIGGLGGQTTGAVNVTPGQQFTMQVGCHGTSAGGASAYARGGAKGSGWSHLSPFLNIYSLGYDGGGGGGATAVLSGSTPLMVAGGGGGAGGDAPDCRRLKGPAKFVFYYCGPGNGTEQGGDGGDGGGFDSEGGRGERNPASDTTDSGGDCKNSSGDPSGPAGGKGEDFRKVGGGGAGGGGGGGYNGGCGGVSGNETDTPYNGPGTQPGQAGNAGGGGQSYVSDGVTDGQIDAAAASGDGYVLVLTSAEGVRTTSFGFTGKTATYCVPDGVDQVFADVLGGAGAGGGGDFRHTGTGGTGSGVQAVLPVKERSLLQVTVGQYGHASGGYGDGHGGRRGEAESDTTYSGAGGGGSSAVKQSTSGCGSKTVSGLSYLAVGAGGGGGGGDAVVPRGGDGGAGGNPARAGDTGGNPDGGDSGCAGQLPGKGCNSNVRGGNGTGALDGGGGGGGGGGYYGGGKGHGPSGIRVGGGGGGGGGRSYVSPGVKQAVHYYQGPRGDRANKNGINQGRVSLIVPIPSTRSRIELVSGNQQTADPGQAFSEPLVVRFVDALDGASKNTSLTLSIPADAGATFADGSTTTQVTTDADGKAQVRVKSAATRPAGNVPVHVTVTDTSVDLVKGSDFTLFNTLYATDVTLDSDSPTHSSPVGTAETFTAKVTQPDAGGAPLAGSTVQFFNDDPVDGTSALGDPVTTKADGTASVTTTLPPGAHRVVARVAGVDGYRAPGENSVGHLVGGTVATALPITSSDPGAADGDSVQYTATLQGDQDAGTFGGTVQFSVDGSVLGDPVTVPASGKVTSAATRFTISPADVGGRQQHEIRAEYSGDGTYVAVAEEYTQYVRRTSDAAVTVAPDVTPAAGGSITITGTVTAQAPTTSAGFDPLLPALTGTLRFYAGGTALTDPIALRGGRATSSPIAVSALTPGANAVTARYSGDDNYAPATSPAVVVTAPGVDTALPPVTSPPPGSTGPASGGGAGKQRPDDPAVTNDAGAPAVTGLALDRTIGLGVALLGAGFLTVTAGRLRRRRPTR